MIMYKKGKKLWKGDDADEDDLYIDVDEDDL
jgi:hypothetical protein